MEGEPGGHRVVGRAARVEPQRRLLVEHGEGDGAEARAETGGRLVGARERLDPRRVRERVEERAERGLRAARRVAEPRSGDAGSGDAGRAARRRGHPFSRATVKKSTSVLRASAARRVDAGGARFNLGEATVTRATLRLHGPAMAADALGSSYVLGSDLEHARLAALFDGMLLDAGLHDRVLAEVVAPLESGRAAGVDAAAHHDEPGLRTPDVLHAGLGLPRGPRGVEGPHVGGGEDAHPALPGGDVLPSGAAGRGRRHGRDPSKLSADLDKSNVVADGTREPARTRRVGREQVNRWGTRAATGQAAAGGSATATGPGAATAR